MSTIERAMSRVAGLSGEQGEAPVAEQSAEARETGAEALGKPPESSAPITQPELVVREQTPAPAVPVPRSEAVLHIDMERLAAMGLLVPDAPTSRQSEEYQHIKRRLLGNMVPGMLPSDRPANLVMITSSVPGEGKTFTSSNLALSIAMEKDHTVLAIDTDIVKSDLSRTFGLAGRVGLYDLLADGSLELRDLLVRTSIPNLVILPSGRNYEATTELLASSRMKQLTREISQRYRDRIVIFDSPPVLATTTAAALAPQVGQLVLVVEAGKTKHETVKEALQMLEGSPITGLILNKSKQPATRTYDYYGYYYRPNADK